MRRGQILLEAMEGKGFNRNSLARETGIAYSTIDSMIKRDLKNASIDNVLKICRVLGIPAETFEEAPTNLERVDGDFVKVPILGAIACGEPLFVEENITEYKLEPANEIPPGQLFYLRAAGDSMLPTISDGALVLIRHQSEVENGEIAAVLLSGNGEATLKRIKKQDDMVMLFPDNSKYDPIFITKDNPAKIIGKALEVRTIL